ncbi:MAG TPA: lantibiotic dehydratase, partial [Kofleriaceae bacterium]
MTASLSQDFTAHRPEQADQAAPAERLAPVAIVRAAAWPLASLTSLVVDDAMVGYADRIELERQRLWALTAGSPTFMRALSLSNPTLAERVELVYADLAQRPRNKEVRHLETTLYRTLARAAGRPTPCDLWAGTTLAP